MSKRLTNPKTIVKSTSATGTSFQSVAGGAAASTEAEMASAASATIVIPRSDHCLECRRMYEIDSSVQLVRACYNFPGCKPLFCMAHASLTTMVDVNSKKCEDCHKVAANFNYPGEIGGRYCSKCSKKHPGTINVTAKRCNICKKTIPSFGMSDDKAPTRCRRCRSIGMIDLKHKRCEWQDTYNRCVETAHYAKTGEIVARYCGGHASDDMFNITHRSNCPGSNGGGCYRRSAYNLPTEKRPIYCVEHKADGMINIRDAKCPITGCPNPRRWNFPGSKVLYCRHHKLDGMIDLVTRECKGITDDGLCTKQPSFNYIGCNTPLYCAKCAKPDMIDVRHARCQDCIKHAGFNYKGIKTPIKCFNHRLTGMISTKHKYCENGECDRLAGYNYAEMKPIVCRNHISFGMVRIGQKVCENPLCTITPKRNFPGETIRRFCAAHAEPGMVDLDVKITKCIKENCINMPLFNYHRKKAIYCSDHQLPGMINLELSKKCCTADCTECPIARAGENYYCTAHYPETESLSVFNRECSMCDLAPNSLVCNDCKVRRHPKEWLAVCHLKRKIRKSALIDTNQPLKGCCRRRPDIYYECNKHVVIVEVDEDQHKRYDSRCECTRISQIVSSIGGMAVTIIRYNPDKITNKGGTVSVPGSERLETLVAVVTRELNRDPIEFQVKMIQLYYDDDHDIYQPYKEENITPQVAI